MKFFFEAEIANRVGVNAALIFEFLAYHGSARITLKKLGEIYPFLGSKEIRNALENLVQEKLISVDRSSVPYFYTCLKPCRNGTDVRRNGTDVRRNGTDVRRNGTSTFLNNEFKNYSFNYNTAIDLGRNRRHYSEADLARIGVNYDDFEDEIREEV